MHLALSRVPLRGLYERSWSPFYILVASPESSAWRRKAERTTMALIRPTVQPRLHACVYEINAQSVKDCAYIIPFTVFKLSWPLVPLLFRAAVLWKVLALAVLPCDSQASSAETHSEGAVIRCGCTLIGDI